MPYLNPKSRTKEDPKIPAKLSDMLEQCPEIREKLSELLEIFDKYLPPKLQELSVVTFSTLTDCGHCVGYHGEKVRKYGYSERQVEALNNLRLTENPLWQDEENLFGPRDQAVIAFAYNTVWTFMKGRDKPAAAYEGRKTAWPELKSLFPEQEQAAVLLRLATAGFFNIFNKQNETEI